MKGAVAFALAVLGLGLAVGCGGGGTPQANFAPRPQGCAVVVYPEPPRVETVNIGTVTERCELSMADEDCLRGLRDQVCRLGGDVVWGVDPKPKTDDGYKRFTGRAAKRK